MFYGIYSKRSTKGTIFKYLTFNVYACAFFTNGNLAGDLINSPGAKMGTWKCLRVQGFMIDPESIGVLKEIKLGCHDGNLGELFLFA